MAINTKQKLSFLDVRSGEDDSVQTDLHVCRKASALPKN